MAKDDRPGWLIYLGKRRPESLADHAEYKEPDRLKVTPVAHKDPKGIAGKSIGRPNRRKGDPK